MQLTRLATHAALVLVIVCLAACARTPRGMAGVWSGPNGLQVLVADDRIEITRPDGNDSSRRISSGPQAFTVTDAGGRAHRIDFPGRRLVFKDLLFYDQSRVLTAYDLDNREIRLRRYEAAP